MKKHSYNKFTIKQVIHLATLLEWFVATFDYRYESLIGTLVFGLVVVFSIIFQLFISGKLGNNQTKGNTIRHFRFLFVAITFISLSYFSDHLGNFLNGQIFDPNFSIYVSVLGYTILITALNLLMLNIINFRTNIRRVIKILAIIEFVLLFFVENLYLVGTFYELPASLMDYSIIIFGLVVVAAAVFTIVSLLVEARSTANKMVRLRLRAAALGTLGVLLDGLANIIHIGFNTFNIDDTPFYRYAMPSMALVFYFTSLVSYYYTLFPPIWLQQRTGVLPPSFTDLMNKQAELKKSRRIPQ